MKKRSSTTDLSLWFQSHSHLRKILQLLPALKKPIHHNLGVTTIVRLVVWTHRFWASIFSWGAACMLSYCYMYMLTRLFYDQAYIDFRQSHKNPKPPLPCASRSPLENVWIFLSQNFKYEIVVHKQRNKDIKESVPRHKSSSRCHKYILNNTTKQCAHNPVLASIVDLWVS